MRTVAAAAALVAVAACNPPPPATARSGPEIRVTEIASGARVVDVVGLPAEDLAAVRDRAFTSDEWTAMLRVTVESGPNTGGLPAVAGSHTVDRTLRFVPDFPLDPRVAHRVIFDATQLPLNQTRASEPWRARAVELAIAAAAPAGPPTTRVTQVFPTGVLLENQLRIYVHFSAPMGARRANDFVRLLNDQGQVVDGAFLPLDVSLWNADHTRYTLLFDPGRVKRGILPNKDLGRPLEPGRRYTLVLDREWKDADGRPLVEEFRRELKVVPAVLEPITPADWQLEAPAAETRAPLTVIFPRALDHALAERSLFVADVDGRAIEGAIEVDDTSTRWTFTPRTAWRSGEYRLGTLPELEDPAGNRVGRAFDFDARQAGSAGEAIGGTHTQALIPFTVAPRHGTSTKRRL